MMRRPSWLLAALLMQLLVSGCLFRKETRPNAHAANEQAALTVFAAASLSNAFTEIARAFEARHPGLEIILNLAGSQQLAQQLSLGAPADVFASANQPQMQVAIEADRIAPDAPQAFARNRLVIVLPRNNPGALESLQDLANPGLRIVMADGAVPVGRYSLVFLQKASEAFDLAYASGVMANVASYEQNVRAVLTKVVLGEADAGIVYTSDLVGADAVLCIDIPDSLNTVAVYPIAPIFDSVQPELARAFIAFVRSSEGQAILNRYGFFPVDPG